MSFSIYNLPEEQKNLILKRLSDPGDHEERGASFSDGMIHPDGNTSPRMIQLEQSGMLRFSHSADMSFM